MHSSRVCLILLKITIVGLNKLHNLLCIEGVRDLLGNQLCVAEGIVRVLRDKVCATVWEGQLSAIPSADMDPPHLHDRNAPTTHSRHH